MPVNPVIWGSLRYITKNWVMWPSTMLWVRSRVVTEESTVGASLHNWYSFHLFLQLYYHNIPGVTLYTFHSDLTSYNYLSRGWGKPQPYSLLAAAGHSAGYNNKTGPVLTHCRSSQWWYDTKHYEVQLYKPAQYWNITS